MDLEEFIKENEPIVRAIVRRSKLRRFLDDSDVDELVYSGLWKIHQKYDHTKSSLNHFIGVVIGNYINDIVKNKHYPYKKTAYLGQKTYEYFADKDFFSEKEWALIEPLYMGATMIEASKKLNISIEKYKSMVCSLENKVLERMK